MAILLRNSESRLQDEVFYTNKPQAKRSDGGQPVRFKSSISYIKNHGNMH